MTISQPKTRDDLIALLSITDPDELQALYDAAYAVKAANVGRVVYYRGLVEFPITASKTANTAASARAMTKWNASTRRATIS